jgi:hypothetical protein
MRSLLLAVALVLAMPAAASAALTFSREGGTLRIVDDPGEAAFSRVTLGPSPTGGGQVYSAYESAGFSPLRSGPGCTRMGPFVYCPAAGVTQIAAALGDGNDTVTVDAGPAALVMDGGPGDDVFSLSPRQASVTIVAGDGDDRASLGGGGVGSVSFDGGPGADTFDAEDFAQSLTVLGGDGDDHLAAIRTTGPVTLDGGAGNDYLSIGSDDPDDHLRGGGRSAVVGGPGNDDIVTGPDGDEDTIDCGPGRDTLRFNELMFRYPSLENRFSLDCPPVGVGLGKRFTLKGRMFRFTVLAPRRIGLLAQLVLPQLRLRAGRTPRQVRLHKGTNHVSIRLKRAALRRLGRHTVPVTLMGLAISPSGDAIEVRRGFKIKR